MENCLKIELKKLASKYHIGFKINDNSDRILFVNNNYNINLKIFNKKANIFYEWKRGLLGRLFFKEEYNRLINLKKEILILLEQNNFKTEEIIRNNI